MKKISLILFALLLWIIPACDDDDDSTSSATGTLVVNYNFSGGVIDNTNDDGTQLVYVYLYTKLGLFPDDFYIEEAQSSSVLLSGSPEGQITIQKLYTGDYYVLVFYDKSLNDDDKIPGEGDLYMLYDRTDMTNYSTASPYDATEQVGAYPDNPANGHVRISNSETETIDIDYETAVLGTQGAWDIP